MKAPLQSSTLNMAIALQLLVIVPRIEAYEKETWHSEVELIPLDQLSLGLSVYELDSATNRKLGLSSRRSGLLAYSNNTGLTIDPVGEKKDAKLMNANRKFPNSGIAILTQVGSTSTRTVADFENARKELAPGKATRVTVLVPQLPSETSTSKRTVWKTERLLITPTTFRDDLIKNCYATTFDGDTWFLERMQPSMTYVSERERKYFPQLWREHLSEIAVISSGIKASDSRRRAVARTRSNMQRLIRRRELVLAEHWPIDPQVQVLSDGQMISFTNWRGITTATEGSSFQFPKTFEIDVKSDRQSYEILKDEKFTGGVSTEDDIVTVTWQKLRVLNPKIYLTLASQGKDGPSAEEVIENRTSSLNLRVDGKPIFAPVHGVAALLLESKLRFTGDLHIPRSYFMVLQAAKHYANGNLKLEDFE